MHEFIHVCERAAKAGIDFQHANKHSGASMPFEPHNIAYLNEKLACIYQGLSVAACTKP